MFLDVEEEDEEPPVHTESSEKKRKVESGTPFVTKKKVQHEVV